MLCICQILLYTCLVHDLDLVCHSQEEIRRHSHAICSRIGYRDYVRFDWRLDTHGIFSIDTLVDMSARQPFHKQ